MKKRWKILVSSAAMLACMIPTQTVFAADATTCEFSLLCTDGLKAHPGDEVTLTLRVNPNGDTLGFEFELGELPEGFTYVEDSLTYLDSAKSKLGWTDYNAYTDGRIGFFINDDSKVYTGGAIELATLKVKVGNDAATFDLSGSTYFAASIALNTMGDEATISYPKSSTLEVPSLELVPAEPANCKEEGNTQYYKCNDDCGLIYKTNDRTQPTTLDEVKIAKTAHDFTAETVDAKYLSTAATCIAPAKYFKSCAGCGAKGTETFENGAADPTKHGNNTEIRDKVEATCTESGYSGDTYCKDCNTKIKGGELLPVKGHKGGEATCSAKAVCEVCKEEYGDVDSTNHKNTEVINAQDATEDAEGYTGDKVCKDCGVELEKGKTIPKIESSVPDDTSSEDSGNDSGSSSDTGNDSGSSSDSDNDSGSSSDSGNDSESSSDSESTSDSKPDNTSSQPTTSETSTPSTPDDKKSVEFDDENKDTGIKVTAPTDAFDKADGIKFNAAPVPEETKDGKFTFDLTFTDKDGKKVQPKVAVTVRIPVMTELKDKTIYVYHVEADGKYTEISCKVENGMVVFTASKFSNYIITSEKLSAPTPDDNSGSSSAPTNPITGVAMPFAGMATVIAGAALTVILLRHKRG